MDELSKLKDDNLMLENKRRILELELEELKEAKGHFQASALKLSTELKQEEAKTEDLSKRLKKEEIVRRGKSLESSILRLRQASEVYEDIMFVVNENTANKVNQIMGFVEKWKFSPGSIEFDETIGSFRSRLDEIKKELASLTES